MSYVATDLATVPAAGFSWYMIFLEDAFEDDLRKDVEKHFLTLGREIGKDAIVVRGFDPIMFRDSVYEAAAFDALEALEQLQPTKLQKGWGWLSKYIKIEPEFFGFGIRVNDMMRDVLARKSAA